MKKVRNKIGLFFMYVLPLILTLGLTLAGMLLCKVINVIADVAIYGYVDIFSASGHKPIISDGAMTLFAEIIMVVGMAAVYFAIMKEKDIKKPSDTFSGKSVLAILFIMVGAQNILGVLLQVVEKFAPKVIEDYNEIMGFLDPSSIGMVLAAVILAPIGEEIAFRGMAFKYARKLTGNFWVANVLQALLFGIAHGNIVQGSYAFGMGIVLGFIYKKYNSLLATMIAHLIFNFCGVFVDGLIFLPLADAVILKSFIMIAVGLLFVWLGSKIVNEDMAARKGEEEFDERFHLELNPAPRQVLQATVEASVPAMNFSTEKFQKRVDKEE